MVLTIWIKVFGSSQYLHLSSLCRGFNKGWLPGKLTGHEDDNFVWLADPFITIIVTILKKIRIYGWNLVSQQQNWNHWNAHKNLGLKLISHQTAKFPARLSAPCTLLWFQFCEDDCIVVFSLMFLVYIRKNCPLFSSKVVIGNSLSSGPVQVHYKNTSLPLMTFY